MALGTEDWDKFAEALRKAQRTPEEFYQECARELAARLLALVIPRTPVGDYPAETGKVGGTLRRGWTAKSQAEAESSKGQTSNARKWAYSLPVTKVGTKYQIEVTNPVEYASYVENGHRQTPGRYVPAIGKRLKASFVEGQYMLKISEEQVKSIEDRVLEGIVQRWLREMFGDD